MDEDGPRAAEEEPEPGRAKTFIRLNDLSGAGGRPGQGDREAGSGDSEAEALPYPALAPVVFFYLSQESRPRSWCLRLVCNPYPLQVLGGEVSPAATPPPPPPERRASPGWSPLGDGEGAGVWGNPSPSFAPGLGGGNPGGALPPPRCPAGKFSGLLQGARCSPPGCGVPHSRPRCPGSHGLRRAASPGVGAGAPGGPSCPGDRPASRVPAPPGTPREPNPSLRPLAEPFSSLIPFLTSFRLPGPFPEGFKRGAIWGEAVVLGVWFAAPL